MAGTGTRYHKRLRDLRGLYADAEAFEALTANRGDEVVYQVTDYRPNANPGDLITGVTRMSPGKVGKEFFMTRGHIHAVIRPELYYGLKGAGLMLMESPDGESRILEIRPHTACYVPPVLDSPDHEFGGWRFCDAVLLPGGFRARLRHH